MSTIPRQALEWIKWYLSQNGNTLLPYKVEALQRHGLEQLSVTELKLVYKGLDGGTLILNPMSRPANSAKKAVWVQAVRSCFYLNDACTREDKCALETLTKAIVMGIAPPAASLKRPAAVMTTPGFSANTRKRSTPCPALASRQFSSATPPSFMPPHAAGMAGPPSYHHHHAGMTMGAARMPFRSTPPPINDPLMHLPLNGIDSAFNQQQHHYQSGSGVSNPASAPGSNIKKEPRDPANLGMEPQTPREWEQVRQLRQMGFTNMKEMLAGLRHSYLHNGMTQQVEEAMVWIVSQREEAEEARKVDLARMRSEATRAERRDKRAQEARQLLLDASMDELMRVYFVQSILLEKCRPCLELLERKNAIRLLSLEKKAYKWYGRVVPWCYICNLCEKLNSNVNGDIDKAQQKKTVQQMVATESDQLERIMYTLSEQKGGVPWLFLQARHEAKEKGLPQSPEKFEQKSDDEVVVVEEDELASLMSPCPKGMKQQKECKTPPREDVIEIL